MVDEDTEIAKGERAWKPSKAELALSVFFGVLFIVEIVACFFLYYNYHAMPILLLSGWVLLIIGLMMMTLPRDELSKRGGVPEGKSWVYTTTIVDTGIYGVVRHPLYVGWLLDIFAMMLISQYWITILVGVVPFASVIYYIYLEDRNNVEKFGQPYIDYQNRVPMMNFVLGAIRARRKNSSR